MPSSTFSKIYPAPLNYGGRNYEVAVHLSGVSEGDEITVDLTIDDHITLLEDGVLTFGPVTSTHDGYTVLRCDAKRIERLKRIDAHVSRVAETPTGIEVIRAHPFLASGRSPEAPTCLFVEASSVVEAFDDPIGWVSTSRFGPAASGVTVSGVCAKLEGTAALRVEGYIAPSGILAVEKTYSPPLTVSGVKTLIFDLWNEQPGIADLWVYVETPGGLSHTYLGVDDFQAGFATLVYTDHTVIWEEAWASGISTLAFGLGSIPSGYAAFRLDHLRSSNFTDMDDCVREFYGWPPGPKPVIPIDEFSTSTEWWSDTGEVEATPSGILVIGCSEYGFEVEKNFSPPVFMQGANTVHVVAGSVSGYGLDMGVELVATDGTHYFSDVKSIPSGFVDEVLFDSELSSSHVGMVRIRKVRLTARRTGAPGVCCGVMPISVIDDDYGAMLCCCDEDSRLWVDSIGWSDLRTYEARWHYTTP